MLKITVEIEAKRTIFKLEGRLTGPWVEELRTCWAKAAEREQPVAVVLNEVTFIDVMGRKLLADMHRQGVELVAAGCMTKAIIEEITREENS